MECRRALLSPLELDVGGRDIVPLLVLCEELMAGTVSANRPAQSDERALGQESWCFEALAMMLLTRSCLGAPVHGKRSLPTPYGGKHLEDISPICPLWPHYQTSRLWRRWAYDCMQIDILYRGICYLHGCTEYIQ